MAGSFALPAWTKVLTGALLTAGIALLANSLTAPALVARLSGMAQEVIAREDGGDIRAVFATSGGAPTRHPRLYGGEALSEQRRARVARAIAALPGVGGVRWASEARASAQPAAAQEVERSPFHCQRDVEALLARQVIQFDQSSARITPASSALLDEVANALKPCGASIVAIAGHSDAVGDEAINLRLSRERAFAVRDALVTRGLPRDGLRAQGYGSQRPIPGIPADDSANRRIEFSVIEIAPLKPTPIDTPDGG